MERFVQLGSLSAYVARPSPKEAPLPVILVIQEWWGLDAQTKSVADRIAGLGYLALAPDLYHGQHADLGDHEKAASLAEQHGPGATTELESLFDSLMDSSLCDGRIGSVGFCFGGRMALSLALRRRLAAVCTFYGGRMQLLFPELHRLRCPVLGLFGDQDESIPMGTIEEFDTLLDGLGVDHEVVVYADSGHAFFRDSDPAVYRPRAAGDAWRRTVGFFSRYMPASIPAGGL